MIADIMISEVGKFAQRKAHEYTTNNAISRRYICSNNVFVLVKT